MKKVWRLRSGEGAVQCRSEEQRAKEEQIIAAIKGRCESRENLVLYKNVLCVLLIFVSGLVLGKMLMQ